jgi:hypothetical protein
MRRYCIGTDYAAMGPVSRRREPKETAHVEQAARPAGVPMRWLICWGSSRRRWPNKGRLIMDTLRMSLMDPSGSGRT